MGSREALRTAHERVSVISNAYVSLLGFKGSKLNSTHSLKLINYAVLTTNKCRLVHAGPYENGLEYVDTQFRLLREDFVKPIRDGINSYLSLPADRRRKELRGQSVRYYWNVSYRGRIAALTNQVRAGL